MPNGVDAELFSPGDGLDRPARAARDRPDDAVVAAFVATLDRAHHFKRLDVAIDALAELDDERRPHGRRRRRRAARRLSRRGRATPGVGDRVHFLGAVPHAELPDVLRAADLFLLTTEPPESFGIVLIEAMACGLPAIATDYPGVAGGGRRRRDRAARRPRRPGRGRRGARASWSPRAPSAAREIGERGPREGGARVELAAAWSTAWTPPTPRRSPRAARRTAA